MVQRETKVSASLSVETVCKGPASKRPLQISSSDEDEPTDMPSGVGSKTAKRVLQISSSDDDGPADMPSGSGAKTPNLNAPPGDKATGSSGGGVTVKIEPNT